MESARKAWENSPNVREKGSPVTSTAPPIASGVSSGAGGPSAANYSSFSSASVPQIPVASVTPTTSLSGRRCSYLSFKCLTIFSCVLPPQVYYLRNIQDCTGSDGQLSCKLLAFTAPALALFRFQLAQQRVTDDLLEHFAFWTFCPAPCPSCLVPCPL